MIQMTRQACLFLFIMIHVSLSLSAQNKDAAVTLPDTLDYHYIYIAGIEITGNKLIKERIIVRELDFKVGDRLELYYDIVIRFEYAFTSIWTHGFCFGFGMPI
jgi:hypothetical protein